MYLRFAVSEIDEDSNRRLGIFHAASHLRDSGQLHRHEWDALYELKEWFNDNLEKPTRFTASKPPFYRKQSKAIAWFKDTAVTHIEKIRQMVHILEDHGVVVSVFKTDRVGYIVYEDEFQIVAEPFSDTAC